MATDHPGCRRPSSAALLQRIARSGNKPGHPNRGTDGHAAPGPGATRDAALIRSCRRVAYVEGRKLALFTGPASMADDDARDAALARLDEVQHPDLDRIIRTMPASWRGHHLRAVAFQLIDAGGLYAQARSASVADRLLLAIIHDLAAS